MISNQVDIMCWQETGVAWHMMQRQDRIHERLRDPRWKKEKVVASHNRYESIERKQFGGTCVTPFDEIETRAKGFGFDQTGLGRYSCIRFEGKH